jgi:hypothetical protein
MSCQGHVYTMGFSEVASGFSLYMESKSVLLTTNESCVYGNGLIRCHQHSSHQDMATEARIKTRKKEEGNGPIV